MSSVAELEQRVAVIERDLQDLRRRVVDDNWLSYFDGAFQDEPAFDEVLRYGREFRESDRPVEEEAS